MTLEDWVTKNHGVLLKIPAGTTLGHDHWYQYPLDHPEHPGEWSTSTAAWKVKIAHEYRPRVTTHDQYVELHLDAGILDGQALKATTNRSGRSKDSGLTFRRVRR